MEQSADREPDVLAQGCRAFGALYATPNNEVNLGLKPGEKMKISSNVQWSKLNNAIIKTVIGSLDAQAASKTFSFWRSRNWAW